jgi:hypothetical protein
LALEPSNALSGVLPAYVDKANASLNGLSFRAAPEREQLNDDVDDDERDDDEKLTDEDELETDVSTGSRI